MAGQTLRDPLEGLHSGRLVFVDDGLELGDELYPLSAIFRCPASTNLPTVLTGATQ